MRIVVLVKRVPDTASVFKIGADGKSVDLAGLKYVMSPYDEYAVEEAVKIKEAAGADVILLSAGPPETKDIIRAGLAMGADSGVLILSPAGLALEPRGAAHALAAALRDLAPDLVLAGKQAVDDDASQVPERVAELLGWPHVSTITQLALAGNTATVHREIEGGYYVYETPLPAVFSTQKGINVPRYPTLPNIMKAKKKEIREISINSLGLSASALASGVSVVSAALPRQARLGRILEGDLGQQVRQLVAILREQEKVL